MRRGPELPFTRRREIAATFARLRAEAGWGVEDVGEYLDCSPAQVSRLEDGTAALRVTEARELLDLYRVRGERRESLLRLVRQASDRNWWYAHSDLLDGDFEALLILEDEACAVRTHQPNLVPGLLQTDRYAWELMTTLGDLPLDVVERRVRLRMARQRILSRNGGARMAVVLDEAALRRPVGRPSVMREQYERLVTLAETERVTIQVLPLASGPHAAMGAAFHIFEFAGDDPWVLQLEFLDREHFADEPEEVKRYVEAFSQAAQFALDPDRSVAFLRGLARRS